MRPVAPRLDGVDEETVGVDSERFLPITIGVAETDLGGTAFVTRWRLSDDDRAAILRGEDLFVTQMHPQPPGDPSLRFVALKVSVGPGELVDDSRDRAE